MESRALVKRKHSSFPWVNSDQVLITRKFFSVSQEHWHLLQCLEGFRRMSQGEDFSIPGTVYETLSPTNCALCVATQKGGLWTQDCK